MCRCWEYDDPIGSLSWNKAEFILKHRETYLQMTTIAVTMNLMCIDTMQEWATLRHPHPLFATTLFCMMFRQHHPRSLKLIKRGQLATLLFILLSFACFPWTCQSPLAWHGSLVRPYKRVSACSVPIRVLSRYAPLIPLQSLATSTNCPK